jgi:glycosyltransferase involved in cell wall biosynthesis
MGAKSGYDQLCTHLCKLSFGASHSVWRRREPRRGLAGRMLSQVVRWAGGTVFYDTSSAAAELEAIWTSWGLPADLIHVLYVEENYGLLSKWRKLRNFCLIGTAHQPPGWWQTSARPVHQLRHFDALIAVSRPQATFFEQHAPGRVYFVPHGVDVDFFRPEDRQPTTWHDQRRFVFCGIWLRDLETLEEIINTVTKQEKRVLFDLIVPPRARELPVLRRLESKDQVVWHHGISDEKLREIYRQAVALILPIHDCTANNALLEAMACGLPVIATNAGGLPDYTAKSFADLLPRGDSQAFVRCMLQLLYDRGERDRRAVAARQHAVENFSWDNIAAQTVKVYVRAVGSIMSESDIRSHAVRE